MGFSLHINTSYNFYHDSRILSVSGSLLQPKVQPSISPLHDGSNSGIGFGKEENNLDQYAIKRRVLFLERGWVGLAIIRKLMTENCDWNRWLLEEFTVMNG